MDASLIFGMALLIALLTALWWRRRCTSSTSTDPSAAPEGTEALSEQEKSCLPIGQEKGKETLTNIESPKVAEENKLEEIECSDVNSILQDKTEEFSVESEKQPSDGSTGKSEELENETIKLSKSSETGAQKEIYEETLNKSVEKQTAEKTLQDPENSLLFVESVQTRKELFGPAEEVSDICELDSSPKELEANKDSEENLNAPEKPERSGDSASTAGGKVRSEETPKTSEQQQLVTESPGITVEKPALETPLKTLEQNKETFIAEELLVEKSFVGNTNKEALGELSETAEDKTESEFSLKTEEKQLTEVSDTSEVKGSFRESPEKEGEKIIQESTPIFKEQEISQRNPVYQYSSETYQEGLKVSNKNELPLEEFSKVLEDQSNKNSKEDKETEPSYEITKTTDTQLPSGESKYIPEENIYSSLNSEPVEISAELIIESKNTEVSGESAIELQGNGEHLGVEVVQAHEESTEILPEKCTHDPLRDTGFSTIINAVKKSTEISGIESTEGPRKVSEISVDKCSEELLKVQEILGEERSEEPQKSSKISTEERSQELWNSPEILVEVSNQEAQKVPHILAKEGSQEPWNKTEILAENSQESQKVLEISAEERSQETQKVSEILAEERSEEAQKSPKISAEESRQGEHKAPEIAAEEDSRGSEKILEISVEETSQEHKKSGDISVEESKQEYQKVTEIQTEERNQELWKVQESLAEENSGEPQKDTEILAELRSEEPHEISEILAEERSQELLNKAEILAEESSQKAQKVQEPLVEERSEEPEKVPEILAEGSSQEPWKSPEILIEVSNQEAQKVLEISAEERSQEPSNKPEILAEKNRQESENVLEISAEERSQEPHKVPEILAEERSAEPQKSSNILAEESSQETQKVSEISGQETSQGHKKSVEILFEESNQEHPKVPAISAEESSEGPQESPKITTEERSQEPQIVHEILVKESSQEHQKVPETSLEERIQEPQKGTEVRPEDISQETLEVLEISVEETSQEPQNGLETSVEKRSQEPQKISEISAEERGQDPWNTSEILAGKSIEEAQKVPEISAEERSQEPWISPEILIEVNNQEAQKVLEISVEERSQEPQKIPEILGEGSSEEPCKCAEVRPEDIGEEEPQKIQETLDEESSEEPQKSPEISAEESYQETQKVPELSVEDISQEAQKSLEISAEERSQESQKDPEISAEDRSQEHQKVAEILAKSFEELQKVSKIFDESCLLELEKDTSSDISVQQSALEPVECKWISTEEATPEGWQDKAIFASEIETELKEAAEISLEESTQELENAGKVLSLESALEPQKDEVPIQDQSRLLVHQLKMTAPSQTRFLILNLGDNNEFQVFRLGKGWTLRFFLGPTLANSTVRIFVNHPLEEEKWDKDSYRELEWKHLSLQLDVCEGHADVTMVRAGSFRYYFTVDGSDSKDHANGCGFFLVDPDLVVGRSREKLPLDGIICQTVISKLLGPFPEWEGRLRVAKETGYNVIHFTPLQELGASNSAYALTDQLKLNPVFHTSDRTFDFEDVERLVKILNDEYELLSFTDLVLNHTANESPWISEHPECVYNLVNSPQLKPAYLLDRCLQRFSVDVADGVWESKGIPPTLNSEEHLERTAKVLHTSVLPELRLSEFYQVAVDEVLKSFRNVIISGIIGDDHQESELRIIPDPNYRRLQSTVNLPVAIKLFYSNQTSDLTRDEKIQLAVDGLRSELEKLNARAHAVVSEHLLTAVKNFVANARYRFVDPNGLRLPAVTREQPIMNRYFVNSCGYLSMEEEETLIHTEKAAYCMAHNGWLADHHNPLGNFAESGSNVYLRRELNSWEDSVKLRYGDTPDDCPYLWERMRKYAIQTAQIFHGVRIDNCHNTPIHVAEWVLAEARAVRPDLYVLAELYTQSEHFDNVYINRLGLNSMVQEALGAGDARNLGSLLLRCSSEPVGAFFQLPLRPLTSSLIHDVLFDQTHDNPSIVEKRSVLDVLPNTALVAMANCAVGSTRGYDEVVPHHISVITESRLFRSWSPGESYDCSKCVGLKTGIVVAKRALNKLHWKLTIEGFSQISVEHLTDDVVAVTRHNPITHESLVLVAHTDFRRHRLDSGTSFIPPLPVQGRLSEVIIEARVVTDTTEGFVPNEKHVCGLDDIQLIIQENIDISESHVVRVQLCDNSQIVEFVQFPASSVIVFRVSSDDSTDISLAHLRPLLACFGYKMRPPGTSANDFVSAADGAELEEIFTELTLNDLNRVLFRCDAEERDDGFGYGVYHVPGFGDLPFCGFAGVMSVLMAIRASNNLDHPLCRNLKEGNWMLDYLSGRLLCHRGTKRLGSWLQTQFGHIKNLPRCLVPCYFDAFVTGVYVALEELAWNKMADFVTKGSAFVRALALASLQVCGVSRSASLPDLSPHLDPPNPAMVVDAEGHPQLECITIAAGLPHFSSGAFRSWGRDTFISMRGLLLVTGRFDEARFLILAFAGCLRHGLIPNFLGCGSLEPRYNSRDAIWWWLQAIQDYCNMAPHGISILQDKVSRRYPRDDSSVLPPGACDQLLCNVIQEALQKHASGVKFRERDAGPKIDNDMTSAGFDVEVGIDWETGFVFGGNEHNCGTWMDKMGSSRAAGNMGKPATPRHGSAVEIVGLCYSAVKWLAILSQQSLFPYSSVSVLRDDALTQVTFQSWSDLIAKNFEPKFWVDYDPQNDLHPDLVNRRGIYRDVYQCSHKWSEYQLRPNFAITVALAPELCNIDHAWAALEQAGEVLMGPLGLKTLDPSDWEYSGFYDNSNWSTDYKTACGFSYHQGPEWIWPVGFFLRAIMQVAQRLEDRHAGIVKDTLSNVQRILSAHHTFIHVSDWKSLPELTNENGEFCSSSCPSQAWSVACILDSLYDAEKIMQTTSISLVDHDHSSN